MPFLQWGCFLYGFTTERSGNTCRLRVEDMTSCFRSFKKKKKKKKPTKKTPNKQGWIILVWAWLQAISESHLGKNWTIGSMPWSHMETHSIQLIRIVTFFSCIPESLRMDLMGLSLFPKRTRFMFPMPYPHAWVCMYFCFSVCLSVSILTVTNFTHEARQCDDLSKKFNP